MAGNKKGLLERLRDLFGNSRSDASRPQVGDYERDPHDPRGRARGHHKGTPEGPPGLGGRMPGKGRGKGGGKGRRK
jgi:hypothetical protein